jgi:hypothetical protein
MPREMRAHGFWLAGGLGATYFIEFVVRVSTAREHAQSGANRVVRQLVKNGASNERKFGEKVMRGIRYSNILPGRRPPRPTRVYFRIPAGTSSGSYAPTAVWSAILRLL